MQSQKTFVRQRLPGEKFILCVSKKQPTTSPVRCDLGLEFTKQIFTCSCILIRFSETNLHGVEGSVSSYPLCAKGSQRKNLFFVFQKNSHFFRSKTPPTTPGNRLVFFIAHIVLIVSATGICTEAPRKHHRSPWESSKNFFLRVSNQTAFKMA